jgi:hypothetical protein
VIPKVSPIRAYAKSHGTVLGREGRIRQIRRYRTADLIDLKQFDAGTQNKYTLSEIRDPHTACNYGLRLHSSRQ